MSRCHCHYPECLDTFFGNSAHLSRNRRKVIFKGRKLRIRASCITARKNRAKAAIKREQSDARIDSAEREQARRQMPSIRAENRPKSEAKIWNMAKNVVPLHCQSMELREP